MTKLVCEKYFSNVTYWALLEMLIGKIFIQSQMFNNKTTTEHVFLYLNLCLKGCICFVFRLKKCVYLLVVAKDFIINKREHLQLFTKKSCTQELENCESHLGKLIRTN
jgi:hypothetical protein